MSNRRDRHHRGIRGPLSLPNPYTGAAVRVPQPLSDSRYFVQCIHDAVNSILVTCPQALAGVDVGMEDVPAAGLLRTGGLDSVPLAAAVERAPDLPARIVIFRRPLERRALDRTDLHRLVHATLVEQLSELTGLAMFDIDPHLDDD